MREKRIWLLMHMQRVVCSDEFDGLTRCYLCVANNYPEKYCLPMYLQVPPDYITILEKDWKWQQRLFRYVPLKWF